MWITNKNVDGFNGLPVFEKNFILSGEPTCCMLKITATGIFSVKINGHDIPDLFMPGWSNYNKYIDLCRYDITKYLKKDNTITVTVANGWYSGTLGYGNKVNVFGDTKRLFAEIDLDYKGGKSEKIVTDEKAEIILIKGVKTLLLRNKNVINGTDIKIADDAPVDRDITVCCGVWAEENTERLGYGLSGCFDENDSFKGVSTCFLFSGVNNLTLKNVVFKNTAGFACQIGRINGFLIENIAFENCFADGLHVNGGVKNGVIAKLNVKSPSARTATINGKTYNLKKGNNALV